jgi:hypothetical protein
MWPPSGDDIGAFGNRAKDTVNVIRCINANTEATLARKYSWCSGGDLLVTQAQTRLPVIALTP